MPDEPKVIDVAPANVGVCRRCGTACCTCAMCVAAKGGNRAICNRCYEAAKKEGGAVGGAVGGAS